LGAIIQIIAIILSFDLYNTTLLVLFLITTAISMTCIAYYGYQIKNFLLVLFALSFFITRLLLVLMV
jgi:hypothetical protein